MGENDSTSVTSSETPWCECNKPCLKRMFCQVNIYWRTVSLSFIVFVYLLIGAGMFYALERPTEIEQNEAIEESSDSYIEQLESLIAIIINSTDLTRNESIALISNITKAAIGSSLTPSSNWEYGSSLFFVVTVVTTIGYGNTAPTTDGGRRFFIIYSLIGIPITLVFLAYLGEILKTFITWLAHPIHKKWSNVWIKIIVIFSFFIAGLFLFVFIPGIIFMAIQDWTYFESIYFCFVTLTTVGFGDFVPGLDSSDELNGLYRTCVAFWIFIGLAFLSLVISLMQETFTKFTRKVQDTRCKCLPINNGVSDSDEPPVSDNDLPSLVSDNLVSDNVEEKTKV